MDRFPRNYKKDLYNSDNYKKYKKLNPNVSNKSGPDPIFTFENPSSIHHAKYQDTGAYYNRNPYNNRNHLHDGYPHKNIYFPENDPYGEKNITTNRHYKEKIDYDDVFYNQREYAKKRYVEEQRDKFYNNAYGEREYYNPIIEKYHNSRPKEYLSEGYKSWREHGPYGVESYKNAPREYGPDVYKSWKEHSPDTYKNNIREYGVETYKNIGREYNAEKYKNASREYSSDTYKSWKEYPADTYKNIGREYSAETYKNIGREYNAEKYKNASREYSPDIYKSWKEWGLEGYKNWREYGPDTYKSRKEYSSEAYKSRKEYGPETYKNRKEHYNKGPGDWHRNIENFESAKNTKDSFELPSKMDCEKNAIIMVSLNEPGQKIDISKIYDKLVCIIENKDIICKRIWKENEKCAEDSYRAKVSGERCMVNDSGIDSSVLGKLKTIIEFWMGTACNENKAEVEEAEEIDRVVPSGSKRTMRRNRVTAFLETAYDQRYLHFIKKTSGLSKANAYDYLKFRNKLLNERCKLNRATLLPKHKVESAREGNFLVLSVKDESGKMKCVRLERLKGIEGIESPKFNWKEFEYSVYKNSDDFVNLSKAIDLNMPDTILAYYLHFQKVDTNNKSLADTIIERDWTEENKKEFETNYKKHGNNLWKYRMEESGNDIEIYHKWFVDNSINLRWTEEEKEIFRMNIENFKGKWKEIAEKLPDKNTKEIKQYYRDYYLKIVEDEKSYNRRLSVINNRGRTVGKMAELVIESNKNDDLSKPEDNEASTQNDREKQADQVLTETDQSEINSELSSEERVNKADKAEKVDKADKAEKVEKVKKLEKLEKLEKLDKADKAEKVKKLDKAEKVEKIDKAENIDKAIK